MEVNKNFYYEVFYGWAGFTSLILSGYLMQKTFFGFLITLALATFFLIKQRREIVEQYKTKNIKRRSS